MSPKCLPRQQRLYTLKLSLVMSLSAISTAITLMLAHLQALCRGVSPDSFLMFTLQCPSEMRHFTTFKSPHLKIEARWVEGCMAQLIISQFTSTMYHSCSELNGDQENRLRFLASPVVLEKLGKSTFCSLCMVHCMYPTPEKRSDHQ